MTNHRLHPARLERTLGGSQCAREVSGVHLAGLPTCDVRHVIIHAHLRDTCRLSRPNSSRGVAAAKREVWGRDPPLAEVISGLQRKMTLIPPRKCDALAPTPRLLSFAVRGRKIGSDLTQTRAHRVGRIQLELIIFLDIIIVHRRTLNLLAFQPRSNTQNNLLIHDPRHSLLAHKTSDPPSINSQTKVTAETSNSGCPSLLEKLSR